MPANTSPRSLFEEKSEEEDDESVVESEFTTWFNPTSRDVRIEVHVSTPLANGDKYPPKETKKEGKLNEKTGKKLYIIKAKSERVLPSEYDGQIQRVKDDVVMSGLAPQLVHRGLKVVPTVHPSLDAAIQAERAATARATQLMLEKVALEQSQVTAAMELEQLRDTVRQQKAEADALRATLAASDAKKKKATETPPSQ
jgi:hypothetical protein